LELGTNFQFASDIISCYNDIYVTSLLWSCSPPFRSSCTQQKPPVMNT